MTKIDIYSGFLGAGKTTLIKKMIQEAYAGEKIVLIENEFGEIGIDGGFLQDAGVEITEMNSGCICCSLVGDFGKALTKVIHEYHPDRIVIEPSGVGKLSDVIAAVEQVTGTEVVLGYTVAVVDASKVKVYMKNFGEFYNNQVQTAGTLILSRTNGIPQAKLEQAIMLLREKNSTATIVTTPWEVLTGAQLVEAMEGMTSIDAILAQLQDCHFNPMEEEETHHCCCGHHDHHEEHHCCGHHDHHEEHHCCGHHDHHHEEHHCCGHHDHHEEHHCCGHHDHHEEHHCCGHHDHHHEEHHCCEHHDHHEEHHCSGHHDHHEEHHCCDHHDHHHDDHHCGCGHDHHHHHADEVFTAWGVETAKKFTEEEILHALHHLSDDRFGQILRGKGIVEAPSGEWIHFDYVPGECNVRVGGAAVSGKLCVIGAQLNEAEIATLFGV